MNIKTILDPIARGEFNRKKAIEKTIKNGIRSVNKEIKENVKKGNKKFSTYDSYLTTVKWEYDLTNKEINYIKEQVEKHFIENGKYNVSRRIFYPFGWRLTHEIPEYKESEAE